MSDVDITPKIRCDNCGFIEEKAISGAGNLRTFSKPRKWGFAKMEGSRSTDSYGGKSRLDFSDLCPTCANDALDAAAAVLKARRDEGAADES